MSIYNKSSDRCNNGRINRKLTSNQFHITTKHAYLKHMHFVQIPRHHHKQLCQQIVRGFEYEMMSFNTHNHKPTLHCCCL